MAESCRGCYYWRPLKPGDDRVYACHYCIDTGLPRCCPSEECIYHTKGMENMSRGKALSPETIGQIEQMNAEGKTISQICEALSVSPATVTRVRNGKLKSPETVSTPIEPVTEDITDSENPADTNIIPEVPEVVKRVPESVLIVIAREISDFDDEIETLTKRLDRLKSEKSVLEKWYFDNKDGAE